MSFDPRSRPVAMVTGGRQGLGKAIALSLAGAGYDLIILDLVLDDVFAATCRDLEAAGARVTAIEGDIANLDAMESLVARAWDAHGSIDCLVNNAGIAARPLKDMMTTEPDEFDRNFAVNVRGTFFLTQYVARRMLADGEQTGHHRSIIVISSMAAEQVSTERAQYCMAKASLAMMTSLFATRLAPAGIMVHEVRPGLIHTDMTAATPESTRKIMESGLVPLARWGEPGDVGKAVATLAQGAIPYATGLVINVDGGVHIPRVD